VGTKEGSSDFFKSPRPSPQFDVTTRFFPSLVVVRYLFTYTADLKMCNTQHDCTWQSIWTISSSLTIRVIRLTVTSRCESFTIIEFSNGLEVVCHFSNVASKIYHVCYIPSVVWTWWVDFKYSSAANIFWCQIFMQGLCTWISNALSPFRYVFWNMLRVCNVPIELCWSVNMLVFLVTRSTFISMIKPFELF